MDRDATRGLAGVAWSDAEPSDKRAALRYYVTRRTANRYRHEGPPWLRAAIAQCAKSEKPWRLAAALMAALKRATVKKLDNRELIFRVHDLRLNEIGCNAGDRVADRRRLGWLELATAAERVAAMYTEKAACYRECARRRLDAREVF